jgi:hypothetical protein
MVCPAGMVGETHQGDVSWLRKYAWRVRKHAVDQRQFPDFFGKPEEGRCGDRRPNGGGSDLASGQRVVHMRYDSELRERLRRTDTSPDLEGVLLFEVEMLKKAGAAQQLESDR